MYSVYAIKATREEMEQKPIKEVLAIMKNRKEKVIAEIEANSPEEALKKVDCPEGWFIVRVTEVEVS